MERRYCVVVLDGAVVGETGVYIYALTGPHQTRNVDVAEAIAADLASRPGIPSVYGAAASPTDRRPPRVLTREQHTLLACLDYLRECLIGGLEGVSEADARRTFVRSGTYLIGPVMHVAQTEHVWVVNRWAGT